jgi:hypothetical protein
MATVFLFPDQRNIPCGRPVTHDRGGANLIARTCSREGREGRSVAAGQCSFPSSISGVCHIFSML